MKIKEYENYEVTCSGEVINTKTGRVLKTSKNKDGYLQVVLYKKGRKKTFKVHRLVAQVFIPNPDNLPEINHKDENKTNNTIFVREDGSVDFDKSNLEWCTHEYNNNYGTRNEKVAKAKSKTVLQLRKDGSLVRVWKSAMEVQRQLGFAQTHISACCRGELYSSYGYKWSYVN